MNLQDHETLERMLIWGETPVIDTDVQRVEREYEARLAVASEADLDRDGAGS